MCTISRAKHQISHLTTRNISMPHVGRHCRDQPGRAVVSLLRMNRHARSSRRLCHSARAAYRRMSTRTPIRDGVATESRRHLESDRWRIYVQWQSLVQVTKCLQLIQLMPTRYSRAMPMRAHRNPSSFTRPQIVEEVGKLIQFIWRQLTCC